MKILAAAALLAMMFPEPVVYPVQIRTIHVKFTGGIHATYGTGQANIIEDGKPPHGFDFTFRTCDAFDQIAYYQARWTDAAHSELVVTRPDVGQKTPPECILHITMKDFSYVRRDNKVYTQAFPKL